MEAEITIVVLYRLGNRDRDGWRCKCGHCVDINMDIDDLCYFLFFLHQ